MKDVGLGDGEEEERWRRADLRRMAKGDIAIKVDYIPLFFFFSFLVLSFFLSFLRVVWEFEEVWAQCWIMVSGRWTMAAVRFAQRQIETWGHSLQRTVSTCITRHSQ